MGPIPGLPSHFFQGQGWSCVVTDDCSEVLGEAEFSASFQACFLVPEIPTLTDLWAATRLLVVLLDVLASVLHLSDILKC